MALVIVVVADGVAAALAELVLVADDCIPLILAGGVTSC